jgi:hypothetical protein
MSAVVLAVVLVVVLVGFGESAAAHPVESTTADENRTTSFLPAFAEIKR